MRGSFMRTGWLKLAAIPLASVFLAAACGSDNSSKGATATTAATTAAPATTAAATATTAGTTTTAGSTTTAAAASGATTTLPPTPGKGGAGKVTVFGVEDS